MSCILRISGESFDPVACLAVAGLVPDKIWHKGEFGMIKSRGPNRTSGFNILASDADFDDWETCLEETKRFIHDNLSGLSRISSFPGLDQRELDFAVARIPGIAVQSCELPEDLIADAARLKLSMTISVYWCYGETDDRCGTE